MEPIELESVRGTKDGVKIASVDVNGLKVKVAVAHGIKNAMALMKRIKEGDPEATSIHFVEVMAYPGGCVCGGGSPKAKTKKNIEKRIEATYSIDRKAIQRVSSDNIEIKKLYERALGNRYGSHQAHELLHTKYKPQ